MKRILFFLLSIISLQSYSQCFEIQTILVDACSAVSPSNDEGFNEMVRFKVGPAALNTSTLTVTWPSNAWTGLIQNAVTATKVAAINQSIILNGNCGLVLEPTGGVLPANAEVLLVTSQNFTVNFNSFNSLTSTLYIIFQNNTTTTAGHFGNYNATPGTRTLTMSFGGACTDTVTYERSNLINIFGTYGGASSDQDGAAVNFTPAGVPTYVNYGCVAPVTPFTVTASANPNTCVSPGTTINLFGTAEGYQSLNWTSSNGTVTNPSNLNATYVVPNNATGTITFTLTATNSCGDSINATTSITVGINPPTVVSPVTYCQNNAATPLTATPSAGGTLNWYGTNATGGTASSTAPTPSTTILGTTTYYVSQTIGGCESTRASIVVTITNQSPTATPQLFCDTANSTPTSVAFDFNNAGQSSFTYTYTIDGGTPVTGSLVAPSNYTVNGVLPGQVVTFTLTWNGICAPSLTASTTVPSFTQLGPFCAGQIFSLPTTSINGKTGTWSPTINNAATTTYTFTPNGGQCASRTSMTVVINPNITPTFNAIAPICGGQTLSPLPTTSTNGVTGTWSPALNNNATTTYTFTPLVGQCSSNATLTITVNPNITPTFTLVSAICSGQALTPLPTTSNNGITGTWSPALNNTATTTYTFTPNVGQCATPATLTITVNPNVTPTFNAVAPVCSGQIMTALPTTSTNGITGTWSPALNNTSTTTYTFTPNAGQCSTTTTLTITVNPNVTPTFNSVAPICDGQALAPLPTTSTNGFNGSWTPAINNAATTIYTFTPTSGQCATTTTLTITVNPNILPTFNSIAPICSGQSLSPLPTTSTNGFTGTWSPALNNTATTTYTFTPTAGQCATTAALTIVVNSNVTPTFTVVAPVCAGQTMTALPTTSANGITGIWSPALNNTTTTTYTFTPNVGQCAMTTTLQIIVIQQVNPVVDIVETCNANTVTVTNPVGIEYEYSVDGLPYQSSPVFNNLASGNHTIVAHHIPANCFSNTTTFTIVMVGNDVVVNNNPPALVLCDTNNDGFNVFDLTSAINSITGGASYNVSFHETITDALVNGTTIPTPANYFSINPWMQTIYVRVESTTTTCYEIVELQLVVNPTPEATEPDDLHLCDYTGAVGYEPFNLTLVIPQVLGSIDPSTHTVTFYTSLADAQTPSNAITNVASYINSVIDQQTIYVRVETTATGCFDIVDFDIIVDPLPNSTQPNYPQYSLCDNDQSLIGYEVFDLQSQVANILLGQTGMSVHFYPSLTDAQNDTNEITNLSYQNAIIYVQTLGIRITNDATGCYVISTMDIRVEPLPTPIPPTQPYTVCDDDQDGFAQFDLNTLTTDILQGANYTLTFHETLTNAQTGDNPLPMLYTNINPFVQIIYVRAEDPTTGCIGITTVELNVNPSPEAITGLPNIEICDTDSNTQNGQTIVNLAQQTPLVLAQQPLPASAYTVTYYTSQTLAEQGSLPIMNVTNYTNTTNPQTIWVRVENIASKCYNIGSFQIIVGTPLVVATPQPINECDDDANPNDQHTNFDLTVRQITALPGYTINYYPSLAEAQTGTNQITTPTNYINVPAAVQTLGVEIISPQGCKSYTTLNIRVLPIPTPRTNPATLAAVCENATGSGQATVDLTATAAYIANGDPNVALHYFYTQSDLENNVNEILTPTAALVGDPSIAGTTINQVQYIYIAVSSTQNFDYTSRPCYKMVEQGFIINPLPVVDIVGTNNEYQVCEDDASGVNDGFEVFDLTSQVADLLEGNTTTPTSNYSVAFYLDAAATTPVPNPSAYTNISNPQPIYVVITNTTTGCTSDIGTFNILVNPKPIVATLLDDFESCDTDGVNDGMMFYDNNPLGLGDYIDDILGATQAPADYMVEFYLSQADAEAGISANAIQNLSTYQVQTGTYWIRVTNNATGCYILDDFNVVIEQLAEPLITTNTGSAIACVDWNTTAVNNNLILDSNVANAANYTFEWYADGVLLSETGPTLAVTDISVDQVVYSVIATSITPANLGCASEEVFFTVVRSGPAANLTYTVTNAFSDTQIITVTNDGYGIYHYSLDDGPILDNGGIFTDVTLGEHTVYVWDVRDVNGYSCGVQSISGVQIIDYPHYFTPNGDGFNDTWNIVGLEGQPGAKIYIFDRYGKLLKQISSTSAGWDGTMNGHLLPSTDYWFTVDYLEGGAMKQFRAHFSLKR
ncbi:T9SS type B sorting domain-containing protein [Flavobacterium capsici]|uniref:T9SS type B sorting domain-containing protein n=1 Tax=Flavobacterium capsici TaxID=3075618 RepID=A0AA96JBA4_9FLAO|nr:MULTISPECIES: T9SS type B sorting domain-containing protein [unclassified Flavobacterium]WNM18388.1 T9SS type B sorting domain-containing protein [Flavobacterium sp. PMR2A8]WNM22439.1 T9SS type B sorting domain-containing protein [Flavobacterium sp. PMTSA4]